MGGSFLGPLWARRVTLLLLVVDSWLTGFMIVKLNEKTMSTRVLLPFRRHHRHLRRHRRSLSHHLQLQRQRRRRQRQQLQSKLFVAVDVALTLFRFRPLSRQRQRQHNLIVGSPVFVPVGNGGCRAPPQSSSS